MIESEEALGSESLFLQFSEQRNNPYLEDLQDVIYRNENGDQVIVMSLDLYEQLSCQAAARQPRNLPVLMEALRIN